MGGQIEQDPDRTFTHPDVFNRGVAEGWAEPETDPTRIDWATRQADALIPFAVVDGRPVNPYGPTGIRYGRNELGFWGEAVAADAVVLATTPHTGRRWVLLIERADGNGWALPGGMVDHGESPVAAAIRELTEETGLDTRHCPLQTLAARYVPDTRASDEAWIVSVPTVIDLGPVSVLPAVTGADDAGQAQWIVADNWQRLNDDLSARFGGQVWSTHVDLIREAIDDVQAVTHVRVVSGSARVGVQAGHIAGEVTVHMPDRW